MRRVEFAGMWRVLLVVALSLPAAGAAPAKKQLRVAVPQVRITGEVPPRLVELFSDALPTELRKVQGVWAVSHKELAEAMSIERQKQLLGCSEAESSACLAELAGALDVDELINVHLSLADDTYTLSWKRVDAKRLEVKNGDAKQFPRRSGEELLALVGVAVESMYPELPLKAGKTRGIDADVLRRLNPPPLPRWVFATTLGASVVAAGVGATFRLLGNSLAAQYRTIADDSTRAPASGAQLAALRQGADSNAQLATIFWCVAGGLAVAALVEVFFTNWWPAPEAAP